MSYYESDLDDAYYDDDYDDVLVEDYDDDIDEDYEDAIVEEFDEAKKKDRRSRKRRGPFSKMRARRRARADARKQPPPQAVKPVRVARAFNKVENDMKKLKGNANLANEGIIIQALSLLVNSPTVTKETATVLDVDPVTRIPITVAHTEGTETTWRYKTKEVSYVTGIDDKLIQQLLLLGAIYWTTSGRGSKYLPYVMLAVFAMLPDLFKGVKLTDPTSSEARTDFKFDAKSIMVMAAAAFMIFGKERKSAA